MKMLKRINCGFLGCFLLVGSVISVGQTQVTSKTQGGKMNSLPVVFSGERQDLIGKQLQHEAAMAFQLKQLPAVGAEWQQYRSELKKKIIDAAKVVVYPDLPLNYTEKGSHSQPKYEVKNIVFQTRPGVYATANLFIPTGKGPFPAVIAMHGHWPGGKTSNAPLGQSLALNGYVCLAIDAWGAGERATEQGVEEYHGANLGASLLNIGETLMGVQISDNLRAVDLLCSLPYVDKDRIGATGASGGGNQTMWLSALDDRIKATMPVVSVGTFESYVMRHNCVCELLPDGLTFTEESGVLGMIAPRALKICNVKKESNPTFFSSEMLRSFQNTVPVYEGLGVKNKLAYQLFDQTHDYWPEIREAMLGWFDLYLKGEGAGEPKPEIPFEPLPEQSLLVFANVRRDKNVESLAAYCVRRGEELTKQNLIYKTSEVERKRQELRSLLKLGERIEVKTIHRYGNSEGWNRLALEVTDERIIPLLIKKPAKGRNDYVVVCHPGGKKELSEEYLTKLTAEGKGIVLLDLWGTGEASSVVADAFDKTLVSFHTLSRSGLWLGKTVLGEWVKELDLVMRFLRSESKTTEIELDATKETGMAALFAAVLGQNVKSITLRDAPISYQFDDRKTVDYYSMAIHLPGFINWGDVALATSLTGKEVIFINPRTMSGKELPESRLSQLKQRIDQLKKQPNNPPN